MNQLKKEIIDKIWELSKESFQDEIATKLLEVLSLFLNWDLRKRIVIEIIQSSDLNSNVNEYHSYYKIFDEKGEYLYALPFGLYQSLNLKKSQFERMDSIVLRESTDSSLSSNGGDYSSGYRVEKLMHPNVELYRVQYSSALFSDFEMQCSDKAEIIFSAQELAELNNSNLLTN